MDYFDPYSLDLFDEVNTAVKKGQELATVDAPPLKWNDILGKLRSAGASDVELIRNAYQYAAYVGNRPEMSRLDTEQRAEVLGKVLSSVPSLDDELPREYMRRHGEALRKRGKTSEDVNPELAAANKAFRETGTVPEGYESVGDYGGAATRLRKRQLAPEEVVAEHVARGNIGEGRGRELTTYVTKQSEIMEKAWRYIYAAPGANPQEMLKEVGDDIGPESIALFMSHAMQMNTPHMKDLNQAAVYLLTSPDTRAYAKEHITRVPRKDRDVFMMLLALNMDRMQTQERPQGWTTTRISRGALGGWMSLLESGEKMKIITAGSAKDVDDLDFYNGVQGFLRYADPVVGRNLIERGAVQVGGMLPAILVSAGAGGLAGAGAKALAGSALAKVPFAAKSLAGLAGGKASTVAATAFWYMHSVPQIYSSLRDAGVSQGDARYLSAVFGLPYAYIENMQIKGLLPKALTDEAHQIASRTLLGYIGRMAIQTAKQTPKEILEEGAQSLVTSFAKQMAEWMGENPDVDWGREISGSIQEMGESAVPLIMLQLLGLAGASLQGGDVVGQTRWADSIAPGLFRDMPEVHARLRAAESSSEADVAKAFGAREDVPLPLLSRPVREALWNAAQEQEIQDAGAVRGDQEVFAEEGAQREGGEVERGADIQQQAEAGKKPVVPAKPPVVAKEPVAPHRISTVATSADAREVLRRYGWEASDIEKLSDEKAQQIATKTIADNGPVQDGQAVLKSMRVGDAFVDQHGFTWIMTDDGSLAAFNPEGKFSATSGGTLWNREAKIDEKGEPTGEYFWKFNPRKMVGRAAAGSDVQPVSAEFLKSIPNAESGMYWYMVEHGLIEAEPDASPNPYPDWGSLEEGAPAEGDVAPPAEPSVPPSAESETQADLAAMTYRELQAEAKRLDVPANGTKEALRKRVGEAREWSEPAAEQAEEMKPSPAPTTAEAQAPTAEEPRRSVTLSHPEYKEDTPEATPTEGAFSYTYRPGGQASEAASESGRVRVEAPELVQAVKRVLGKVPFIGRKLTTSKHQPYGVFKHTRTEGKIGLRHDIFIGPLISTGLVKSANAEATIGELIDQIAENTGLPRDEIAIRRAKAPRDQIRVSFYHRDANFAERVLAHEIGHAWDWAPDKTMDRGNILGRIATLHKYIGDFLGRDPQAEKPLTAAEREYLRQEAERQARVTYEEEVNEEIGRTLPITAEDVKAIWNSVMDARELTPELYDYVAGLSSAAKKSIAAQALKGEVAEDLQRFARSVRETRTTTRTVTREGTREEVRAKYREMFEAEVRRRQLWEAEKITEELKELTQWWNPFDADADKAYTAYRHKASELYAEAISVLLNNPAELEQRAPLFTQAFFSWLGQKPEVQRLYQDIQTDIRAGNTSPERVKRLRSSIVEGNLARQRQLEHKSNRSIWKALRSLFVDIGGNLKAEVRKQKKAGAEVAPEQDPGLAHEYAVYEGSEGELHNDRVRNNVARPLKNAGLEWLDLEEYAFHQRVINERGEMANPQGWSPKTSQERVNALRNTLSPEQYAALVAAYNNFWAIRKELVLPKVEAEQMWSDELMATARDNQAYVKFSVTEFIEKAAKLGRGVAAAVFRQYGTLQDVAGPMTETILKDKALMRSADWNTAKRLAVAFLQEFGEVPAAEKVKGKDGRTEFQEPTDAGQGLLVYMHKGKPQGFYVDKWYAEAYQGTEPTSRALRVGVAILRGAGSPFRLLFTGLRPGFWAYNVIRDYKRATKNLKGAKRYNFLSDKWFFRHWLRGVKPAFRSAFGRSDATIDEMRKAHMLISVGSHRGRLAEDVTFDTFVQELQDKPPRWHTEITSPFRWLYRNVLNVSEALERIPKVGGHLYLLEQMPELTEPERAHIVRNQVGSPSFLTKGKLHALTNNIFLFSNAMVQATREDYQVLIDRPAEMAMKLGRRVVAPAALKWTLRSGALVALLKAAGADDDDDEMIFARTLQRLMQNISDYDMLSYVPIPLGFASNGKTVYLRLPMDEGERLLSGVTYKLLDAALDDTTDGHWAQLFEYGAGQLPSVNPAISTVVQTLQFLGGQNPYDYFRGREVVPATEFRAGGKAAIKEFGKHLSNQLGATLVYRFGYDQSNDISTEIEDVLRFPGFGDTMGRFLKVSEHGTRQLLNQVAADEETRRAREILRIREAVKKEMAGKPLSEEEARLLKEEKQYADYRRDVETARGKGGYAAMLQGKTRAARDAMGLQILEREEPGFDLTTLSAMANDAATTFQKLQSESTKASERSELRKWLSDRKIPLGRARVLYYRRLRERARERK